MTTDKTPATLAVDVLAAMDAAVASFMEMGWSQDSHPMQEARAAVTELIQAATEGRNETFGRIIFDEAQANHLRTALARVKGESA